MLCVCTRIWRVLVLNSYPDPPTFSGILYPSPLHIESTKDYLQDIYGMLQKKTTFYKGISVRFVTKFVNQRISDNITPLNLVTCRCRLTADGFIGIYNRIVQQYLYCIIVSHIRHITKSENLLPYLDLRTSVCYNM